jgi:hypothetical protein
MAFVCTLCSCRFDRHEHLKLITNRSKTVISLSTATVATRDSPAQIILPNTSSPETNDARIGSAGVLNQQPRHNRRFVIVPNPLGVVEGGALIGNGSICPSSGSCNLKPMRESQDQVSAGKKAADWYMLVSALL